MARLSLPYVLFFLISCLFLFHLTNGAKNRMDEEEAEATVAAACQRHGGVSQDCIKKLSRWCRRQRNRGSVCRALKTLKRIEKNKIREREGISTRPPRTKPPPPPTKPPTTRKQTVQGAPVRVEKADPGAVRNINSRLNNKARRRKQQQDSMFGVRAMDIPKKKEGAEEQHTEMSVNKDGNYFAGDLELSISQAQRITEELDEEEGIARRRKRKVGKAPIFLRWNKMPISYQFAGSVPTGTRNVIKEAIKLWESNTCVRWEEDGPNTDRVEFYNGPGCSSYVGRTGGLQEISIATPGCNYVGIVAHEIGHSLGFFHEQARPDQSKHVNIVYNNISPFRWNNFVPQDANEVNNFNLPYDYGSVMHYDGYGFAINPSQVTIATTDPRYQDTIGQRSGPSFVDFAQVNSAYCGNKCSSKSCLHGGYADPNDCSKCKCPGGYSGSKCEQVEYSKCGGELKAYSQISSVTSPNYPNHFSKGQECAWLIKADAGFKVFLEFKDTFNFACRDTCDESYVEIKTGPEFRKTGYRFCCNKRPTEKFESSDNEIVILFRGHGKASPGFKVNYWSDSSANKPGGKVTPKPVTPPPTTTTTTKKSKPGEVTTNRPGCNCGEWLAWESACSSSCGGCGTKTRKRPCNNKDCYDTEKRKCNFDPCQDKSWLWENGKFSFLLDGCCLGLFRGNDGKCGGLQNAFVELLSSFLPNLDSIKVPA